MRGWITAIHPQNTTPNSCNLPRDCNFFLQPNQAYYKLLDHLLSLRTYLQLQPKVLILLNFSMLYWKCEQMIIPHVLLSTFNVILIYKFNLTTERSCCKQFYCFNHLHHNMYDLYFIGYVLLWTDIIQTSICDRHIFVLCPLPIWGKQNNS